MPSKRTGGHRRPGRAESVASRALGPTVRGRPRPLPKPPDARPWVLVEMSSDGKHTVWELDDPIQAEVCSPGQVVLEEGADAE